MEHHRRLGPGSISDFKSPHSEVVKLKSLQEVSLLEQLCESH